MEAELALSSRRKVGAFMEDIRSGKSSPLKNITSNYHYHKGQCRQRRDAGSDRAGAAGKRISGRGKAAGSIKIDRIIE